MIGLETHVELGTVTKMFCGSPVTFGAEPNTAVCPVCLGLPGSLPVINKTAIEYTIKIGLALNCSIATWCRFARKNYFYPDMPKNFQISQYDEPLCTDGWLKVEVGGQEFTVGIERVHLEEDTGKSLHVGGATGRIHGADYSLVDYNRAGIPLVEIVTKPIPGTGALRPGRGPRVRDRAARPAPLAQRLRRPDGAGLAALRRQHLDRAAGAGVGPQDRDQERQLAAVGRAGGAGPRSSARPECSTRGGRIVQETRHFQEDSGTTTPGRSKEEAQDYRYFPEPDLVPLAPSREWVQEIRASLARACPRLAGSGCRRSGSFPTRT